MEERSTWFRADCPKHPSNPSIPHEQEFPFAVDEEEQQRLQVRQRIQRSIAPRIPPQILPQTAPQPAPPMAPPVVPTITKVLVEPSRREAQRRRSLSGVDHSLLNPPRCDAYHPTLPIYPPMPTQVSDRPGPSMENPNLSWFGDLIHGQSHVLHQILWKGRIADNRPILLFELTFEGNNFDGIWGPNTMAYHPRYGGIGFHRWIYGQSRELPMDQRGAHLADMLQRTLRFLDIPDPFPSPPTQ